MNDQKWELCSEKKEIKREYGRSWYRSMLEHEQDNVKKRIFQYKFFVYSIKWVK